MRGLQGEGGITWTYKMLQAEMTQVSHLPVLSEVPVIQVCTCKAP